MTNRHTREWFKYIQESAYEITKTAAFGLPFVLVTISVSGNISISSFNAESDGLAACGFDICGFDVNVAL